MTRDDLLWVAFLACMVMMVFGGALLGIPAIIYAGLAVFGLLVVVAFYDAVR